MSLRCTNPDCLFENTFDTPFCMGCGSELRTGASDAYTPSEFADEEDSEDEDDSDEDANETS